MRILPRRFLLTALAGSLFLPLAQSAPLPTAAQLQSAAQASFREWAEVLALPNDSVAPADIQRNADWFEQAFKRRGLTTKQLANNGKPMLFAELPGAHAGSPTVLFYMHLDGQAVKASEWQQESPWTPTL